MDKLNESINLSKEVSEFFKEQRDRVKEASSLEELIEILQDCNSIFEKEE